MTIKYASTIKELELFLKAINAFMNKVPEGFNFNQLNIKWFFTQLQW
jgi:hypothetical protein